MPLIISLNQIIGFLLHPSFHLAVKDILKIRFKSLSVMRLHIEVNAFVKVREKI